MKTRQEIVARLNVVKDLIEVYSNETPEKKRFWSRDTVKALAVKQDVLMWILEDKLSQ